MGTNFREIMATNADRPKRKQNGGSIDIAWENATRAKLQASAVCNRLIDFVNGTISLEPHQVTAALGLLRKILPDLTASTNKTEVTHRYVARIPGKAETVEQWQEQNAQPTTH